MPAVRRDQLYIVAWADPSGGLKKGKGHSRSAIVVVGEDDRERIFILDVFIQHCATNYYVEQIFKMYAMWHPVIFGIDSTGTQIVFAQQLRKEAQSRGVPLPLRPIALHSDKVFQIEHTIQPIASGGRLFRPPEASCKELKEEWVNFPSSDYRDGMDATACAIRLLPSGSMQSLHDLTQEQYRRYLERSGYTSEEIQHKLALRQ